MSSADDDSSGPSISPSIIVGIVILSAAVVVIIAASVFRFYSHSGNKSAFDDNNSDLDLFNPNQVRPASQVARMKEVRWINNMYAWERGRQARLEIGELRPTTMFAGNRQGEARDWDEWSVCKNRESTMANATGDHSNASHFYNVDDPYAQASHQRLSQAASVLLPPQPGIFCPNQGRRDSRLRYSEAAPQTSGQQHEHRGPITTHNREYRGRMTRRDEELNTDVAVVDDSPTPRPSGTKQIRNEHTMEDLAAGLGVGLGFGPAFLDQENGSHEAIKNNNRETNGTAPPTIIIAPPPVRR